MNVQTPIRKQAAVRVAEAETAADLNSIHDADCAAALWRRDIDPEFQGWIDNLPPDHLPRGRVIVKPTEIAATVAALCQEAGLPASAHRDWLIGDIAHLGDTFAGIMRTPYLRLRLDVVTGNACKKFHIDALTARLICTYRGSGTHYGASPAGADPHPFLSVATGSPFVLRGAKFPAPEASGLLHRSPPIEGTGEARLLLVLDPVEDRFEEI